jgi:hypothetical protein
MALSWLFTMKHKHGPLEIGFPTDSPRQSIKGVKGHHGASESDVGSSDIVHLW